MPWKESRIVDQRLQFLSTYQKEEMSVSELCREFGVSRPTGYRWINRYKESGPEGLLNLSSKPHSCSHATPETHRECNISNARQVPFLGSEEAQGETRAVGSERGVAGGQHLRQYSSTGRPHESEAQEAAHDA